MKATIALVVCVLTTTISAEVCYNKTPVTRYRQLKGSETCGWWGWKRCTVYRREAYDEDIDVPYCCTGSFGHIESGCNGECPYAASLASSMCGGRNCRDYTCDTSSFPTPADLSPTGFHENDNLAYRVLTAAATCFVQYTCPDCSCSCDRRRRSVMDRSERDTGCSCSKTVPCASCVVSDTRLFEVRNNVEIWKRACSSLCRNCTAEPGCFGASASYDTRVTCSATNYDYNDEKSLSVTLTPRKAKAAVLSVESIKDLNGSAADGYVVAVIGVSEDPAWGNVLRWSFTGATSRTTSKTMFRITNWTGFRGAHSSPHVYKMQLETVGNLSNEPSQDFNLTVCAHTRRHDTCIVVPVKFVTTVAPATTPAPQPRTYCRGVGAYENITAMNAWCEIVCHHSVPYCPESHCLCTEEPAPGYHYCTPVDIWKAVNGMEAWCDFACNDPDPDNVAKSCLSSYCECDPPVDITPSES